MTTPEALIAHVAPITEFLAQADWTDPDALAQALEARFPAAEQRALSQMLLAGRDAGWLTPKRATDTLTFGRVAKPGPATHGHSLDAVDMSGAGAAHTHPNGEVSFCVATEGDPRFCGHPAGWVAVAPGSGHIPEVTGGRMVIVYFLPEGAMVWG